MATFKQGDTIFAWDENYPGLIEIQDHAGEVAETTWQDLKAFFEDHDNRWVGVDERLPEKNTNITWGDISIDVLTVSLNGEDFNVACYEWPRANRPAQWVCADGRRIWPSHWRELPKPPKR